LVNVTVVHTGPPGGAGLMSAICPLKSCTVCEIVMTLPPIVIEPFRVEPALGATVYVTIPFPVPLAPEVTVIHELLLVAVHAHPVPQVTLTMRPVPPAAASAFSSGLIE